MAVAIQQIVNVEDRTLTRSPFGLVGGVCAGLSARYGVNVVFLRIVFLIAAIYIVGLLVYLYLVWKVPLAARGQEPIVPAAPRKRNLFTYMVGGVGIVATTIGFANNLWDFWEGVTEFSERVRPVKTASSAGSLARARAAAASFTAVASPPSAAAPADPAPRPADSNLRPWQVAPKTPPADPAPRLADSNARPWQVAPKTPPADPAPRLADSNLRPWQVAPKAPPADPAPRLADSNVRPWQIVPKTPQVALPRSLRLPDAVGLRGRIMVQWTTPTGGAHLAEITMNGGSGEATIVAPDLLGLGFATERLSLREVGGRMKLEGSAPTNSRYPPVTFILVGDAGRSMRVTEACGGPGATCSAVISLESLSLAQP